MLDNISISYVFHGFQEVRQFSNMLMSLSIAFINIGLYVGSIEIDNNHRRGFDNIPWSRSFTQKKIKYFNYFNVP